MSLPDSDADRSLLHHLEGLYALVRVLAGPDEAAALLRAVYEHAAQVPPPQRPSDERAWLFRLVGEARDGDLAAADPGSPADGDSSFTNDPFRREVAAETAERRLPVAFAACSLQERFVLAIDVLSEPSDEVLAAALNTSPTRARSVRDQARSALRASLRDVLRGPERMLVDVALPDDVLREHLRDLLLSRFPPAPASLQSSVMEILDRAQAQRERESPSTESTPLLDGASVRDRWKQALTAVRDALSLRGLIGGIVFLVVVMAGIGSASYLFSSSPAPPSPRGVVDLSAAQADRVERVLQTETPSRASAYVYQTWDRRISVPRIEGASLRGVGQLSLPMDTDVPALLYADDETGTELVALAFNYALLDQLGDRATLDRTHRTRLATNETLLAEQRGDRAVVLWRQRDDIFVLVAPSLQADTLRSRIRL